MLISVCLCTYKRETLRKTLDSLINQQLPEHCSLEVVVVDNDADGSGREICESFQTGDIPVHYHINSQRNLAAVRNATMQHANGDLLAFIDDDEWAESDWLASLYQAMNNHEADAVFGYVNVLYPEGAPDWIAQGDMFGKDKHPSGTVVSKGATSSALLQAHWVKDKGLQFDPVFGKSGGEDTDFFHRIHKAGGKLVFINEAVVSEVVEAHRLNMEYLKKQNIRIGQTHWSYLWSKQSGFRFFKTGLFVVAQIVGAAGLAVIHLPFGKRKYAKWYLLLIRNIVKIKTAIVGGNTVELYGNT